MKYILALDQGTTSSKAIIFTTKGEIVGINQKPIKQIYQQPGWVEHQPQQIWQSILETAQKVITANKINIDDIISIGITNQRETVIAWDSETGEPLYNAIVWQDRRTAELCQQLKSHQQQIKNLTGLLLDPYFSATKIHWLLQNVAAVKQALQNDRLKIGTVDSYLLWMLTGGKVHATDVTNASRTLLLNIKTQIWEPELLKIFDIPLHILPEIYDCGHEFGVADKNLFGKSLPITAMLGDQQAATVGQACFSPGMIKSTYGTGCFVLLNTGEELCYSSNNLLTTIAYRFNGECCYALEGSIFNVGTVIQWLRQIGIISRAAETEDLAAVAAEDENLYFIPAFTGLGAPYWDPYAKAAILGISRGTTKGQLVKAALQSIALQTQDLLLAFNQDYRHQLSMLRVDGGMVNNKWLMQCISNVTRLSLACPHTAETTALGAAFAAALTCGEFSSLEQISAYWKQQQQFNPIWDASKSALVYNGWQQAIKQVLNAK